MATESAAVAEEAAGEGKEPPSVLLLCPLGPDLQDALSNKLRSFQHSLSEKIHLLKPWEEPSMPINLFLGAHAQSVRVLLSTGSAAPVDSDIIRCLPNLELVITTSAGVNHIDMAECRQRGISVANSGNAFSEDVADYAVGLLLDVLRRISASERYVRRGLWPLQGEYRPLGSKVGNKKVGIVGLGNIGLEIAKRLEAFGCSIAYKSRRRKPVSFPYFQNIHDLAARSDVLIVACALTDETYHIINRDVLSALGKDGIIINIGRGKLIDEKQLVRCLMQGEVGGAGLDVFENEPAVPQELFALDNVVLSPHRAVFTPESFSSLLEVVAGNLEAFFTNKSLLTPVKE